MCSIANRIMGGHLMLHGQGVHVVYSGTIDTLFEQQFQENLYYKVHGWSNGPMLQVESPNSRLLVTMKGPVAVLKPSPWLVPVEP